MLCCYEISIDENQVIDECKHNLISEKQLLRKKNCKENNFVLQNT